MSLAVQAAALLPRAEGEAFTADIRTAAREFEAYFVAEMQRIASKPLMGETPFTGGRNARMYREQFHQEVARRAAQAGGIGLAEWIERRLAPQTEET